MPVNLRLGERLGQVDLPHYWDVLLGAILAAFGFAIWKSRRATPEESRRFALFLYGAFLGSLPLMLVVLATSHLPSLSRFFRESRLLIGILVYPPFLAVPLLTTYSLLVDDVLDLKLVVRRAVQYALARHAVLAAVLLPPAYFAAFLYAHRSRPLDELLAGWRFGIVLLAFAFGLTALRWRRRLLDAIDRSFFREQLNSKDTLGALVRRSREVGSDRELAALLEAEIDRALHLESVALLCRTDGGPLLAPTSTARPLSAASRLASLLNTAVGPLEFDWSKSSAHHGLPDDEAQWLADGGFRLLIPLTAIEGELLGVLCLGEKRSELPFSSEDLSLLKAAADSAATTLENFRLRSTPLELEVGTSVAMSPQLEGLTPKQPGRLDAVLLRAVSAPTRQDQAIAYECSRCGTVVPRTVKWCEECTAPTIPARVPQILAGKFQFEARIGKGGMGVVYRARDLTLGRLVAIKTLPRVASRYVARLRREARAMAAVTHPNLALIHGAESWFGQPMLIFEYLSGGTLADRLDLEGTLPIHKVIDLGVLLADVLSCIHDAGILHRDIKPSNVGFTLADVPKLLDFGYARLLGDSWRESAIDPLAAVRDGGDEASVLTATGEIVGTPPYLSPEAVCGESPQPSFDLWSLCLLLYEAWTGTNPLRGATLEETLANVAHANVPDIRTLRPDTPREVAQFFAESLAPSRRRRPRSASQLRERLESLRS